MRRSSSYLFSSLSPLAWSDPQSSIPCRSFFSPGQSSVLALCTQDYPLACSFLFLLPLWDQTLPSSPAVWLSKASLQRLPVFDWLCMLVAGLDVAWHGSAGSQLTPVELVQRSCRLQADISWDFLPLMHNGTSRGGVTVPRSPGTQGSADGHVGGSSA